MHQIRITAAALLTLSIFAAWAATAVAQDDQHLPPIECPLRKAGINPQDLKPFEEVEKYIAFLERPERAKWQKPDEVVKALGLRGDEVLVDLGAGSGYFSFRFAKALPKGRVYAIDTEAEMVRHIHHKAMEEGVSNVQAQLAKPDDPALPSGADIVFICDVLHHVQDRPAWLKKLHDQVPAGAKLVMIEFKTGKLPEGPPEGVKISKDALIALCKDAGFTLKEDKPKLLPYQQFLVFEKP
jgi:arsenite methyltransferase